VKLSSPLLGSALLAACLGALGRAQPAQGPLVRMAELEIDPSELDQYRAAVAEEIETSIRMEPGVLAIYAVSVKDSPSHLRFFEIYADEAAYKGHLDSAHFKRYVDVTRPMILSRKLLETTPVVLGSKAKGLPGCI